MASDVPDLRDILAARRAVAQQLGRTKLNHYPGLSDLVGTEVAEHAGAAPLAAALAIREQLVGRKVVLVQSGGNITADALGGILQRHAALASD